MVNVGLGRSGAVAARLAAGIVTGFVAVVVLSARPLHGADAEPFRGVVTFCSDASVAGPGGFVVQQDGRAVWVLDGGPTEGDASDDRHRPRVRVGDLVVVAGRLEPGAHASRIRPDSVRILGTESLPAPVESSGRVFLLADDALRSSVTGVVQRARCDDGVWHLALFVDGRRLYVRSARGPHEGGADGLIDAEVRVTGVNGSIRNSRGQLLAPLVMINGFDDIERLGGPPPAEFDTEFVPLEQVGRFGAASLAGHRFQTEGVVTRSSPGSSLFLQAEATGVLVELEDKQAYAPGDRVRVAGFLDLGQQVRGIAAAVVRRVGSDSAPRPVPATAGLISAAGEHADAEAQAFPDYANRLVTCRGTIIGSGPGRDGGTLQLATGKTILTAKLQPAAYASAARHPPGTEIAVTGIVRYELARQPEERVDGRVSPFDKFSLLVHLPEDVVLVRSAPWWTPLRLALALAGVLAVLAAALAWAWTLRRQVQRHVVTIATEMRDRREAAVEYQATLRERTRLAASLHDTLLQTMAGIGFQIEACQMAAARPESGDRTDGMRDHLDIARRMIDHAVDDLRGSVWALRSATVAGLTLDDAIRSAVARMGEGRGVAIEVRGVGLPQGLPSFVTGNLVLVAQEAVFNALQHGSPRTVAVEILSQPRTVEIVVRDDGSGFEPGGQRGPATGHFGIQGMRERAERLGGRLSLESEPGRGTTVRCLVPRRDYDHSLEEVASDGPADRLAEVSDGPLDRAARVSATSAISVSSS